MRKRNTGKPSQTIFETMMTARFGIRAYVYQLTDAAEVHGMNAGQSILVKKQPSDFVVTLDGDMHYAEVKSTIGDCFKKSLIKKGQLIAARKQVAARGGYFFYVHALTIGRWFKLPASLILNSAKASWKWGELEAFTI
jgi:hypothetical protein